MLANPDHDSQGYIVLETLVSASLVAIISAGLWQLVVATRHLTTQSSRYNEPACEAPACSQSDGAINCSCGEDFFVILP
jgi:hypothetical protein